MRARRIRVAKARMTVNKKIDIRKVKIMESNSYSKYGEVGKTAELLNSAVRRSGITMSQLSDIEEEAKKEYAKSRIR